MGISVIVLTKNEQTSIRLCLNSVKSWADEIILVDDGSTDQTAQIATQEYQARVIVHPLNNDFATQRNIGNEAATQEWIFQMDADEIVPVATAQSIKTATQTKEFDGYELLRRDCIFNAPLLHVGSCFQRKLFRKSKAKYEGVIHESPHLNGSWGRIDGDVLHYPISSIASMITKLNFYTDLECAKYCQENPLTDLLQIKKQLLGKTIKTFLKHYFHNQGRKDGIAGLVWSIIHTLHPIIFWLKVTEAIHRKDGEANAQRH